MAFNATTGIGTAARVKLDSNQVTLSVSATGYPATHQIEAEVTDVAGTVQTGVSLVLTAAANASGGTTVYTGTITGGASNAFKDFAFTVAGFDTAANNGYFVATASTTTTLTLTNAAGVADTHAATAVSEDSLPLNFLTYQPSFASVSATGLITALVKGEALVEANYPAFGNTAGTIASTGNIMNGSYSSKIHGSVNVTILP